MEIMKWGTHAFSVTSSKILGTKDLTIKTSTTTEDGVTDGEGFVKVKNKGATEITFTAILNALVGADVQTEAMKLLEAARTGETGYLYCAGAKVFTCSFMAVDAQCSNIAQSISGEWVSCEVEMKLKQSSKFDGNTTVKAASKGGNTPTKDGVITKAAKTIAEKTKDTLKDVAEKIKAVASVVNSAQQQSQKILADATTPKKSGIGGTGAKKLNMVR